jgi:uncharacterized protein
MIVQMSIAKRRRSQPDRPSSGGMPPPLPAYPPFLRVHESGVCLAIKLQPRSSRNEIDQPLGDELKVKVTAPPVDAAANEALLRLLAETLGCARGAVQLVHGHTSRHKSVFIHGMEASEVLDKLSK